MPVNFILFLVGVALACIGGVIGVFTCLSSFGDTETKVSVFAERVTFTGLAIVIVVAVIEVLS